MTETIIQNTAYEIYVLTQLDASVFWRFTITVSLSVVKYPFENISFTWRCYHNWWRASKFRSTLGTDSFWAGRPWIIIIQHLSWFLHYVTSKGPAHFISSPFTTGQGYWGLIPTWIQSGSWAQSKAWGNLDSSRVLKAKLKEKKNNYLAIALMRKVSITVWLDLIVYLYFNVPF